MSSLEAIAFGAWVAILVIVMVPVLGSLLFFGLGWLFIELPYMLWHKVRKVSSNPCAGSGRPHSQEGKRSEFSYKI